jgi:hypothetical protein
MKHTVNDAPTVLATADLLAVNHYCLLRADDSKGENALYLISFALHKGAVGIP